MSLTPEQILLRRQGLTASDMVALSGTVPFKKTKTVYDIYLDKCEPDSVKPTEVTEAMELGHEVEPVIVARVAKKLKLAVAYPQTTVRHATIRWAMATPDAKVIEWPGIAGVRDDLSHLDPTGLIEAKLVGTYVAEHWGDTDDVEHGPPDYVYSQVVWQMFVTGLPFCIVGAMIGTEVRTYRIEFDDAAQDYAEVLVEIGEKFLVDHVRPRRPPPVDGSESSRRMLSSLFRKDNGIVLKADMSDEEAARVYFKGRALAKEGEKLMDDAKTVLMAKMQNAYQVRGDGWRANWGNQKGYHVDAYDVDPMRKFDLREKKR